ncbi:1,6-dihydroxycyclohexa-2,4-diene-1-carboxylate dehydrogenase (plasmid) [Simplicispira suum]|uniref:1,6-dihydroxycyclohexa-2,4-diene-1-carboxylate dehydrogenase n=1 Tax=Simplicispira suum TaxID=2109915 RepID=A0A2S0N6L3_9BURK|nr:1,6-dihydroxycyclohexa-2,4-diene-1-carboxylate dehydrogenase [Simplicispira suum]
MQGRRFEGRVVIVTGAAQGIGRATAFKVAAEGAKVVVADMAETELLAMSKQMEVGGAQVLTVHGDLSTARAAKHLVQIAVQTYGRVDAAILNVGGTIWFKPLTEYQPEEIEKEINRSLWPTLWCAREIAIQMKRQRCGSIVTVGSTITGGGLYRTPYAAAKGGVHAFTNALAREISEFNVRVNCVAPGAIDNGVRRVPRNTELNSPQEQAWEREACTDTMNATPMRRLGTTDEVANAICFLASDEASYITGQVLSAGGGLSD